ncbi:hypothetical protein RRF57_000733 [Xylaria bambusicola]|uniref:Stress response RCI peptide n=1 Tax=Xylaria bambusicola TaxID=326684 RepID=A0AAN7UCQ6_9PEZI
MQLYPVWVKCGLCSADSIINILLCFLGYIPGLFHAWYIIAKFPDTAEYERVTQQDYEHGHHNERVTYVIVPAPHTQAQQQSHQQQAKHSQQQVSYGTTSSNTAGPASSNQNEASGSSGSNNNERAPPTYAEAVKGDHKIQSDE